MRDDMEHEVALLKTVAARLPLPIPNVVSYDASADNAFKVPYIIQTRLPGKSLGMQLCKELNIEQKTSVAKRIAGFVSQIASLEGPAGDIAFETHSQPANAPVKVKTFHTPAFSDEPESKPTLIRKPLEHLLERCEQWRAYQRSGRFCFHATWDGFAAISRALDARGFLNGPCVLVHGNLECYNMLALVRSATDVEITGVTDWDSAILTPEFMAYCAPYWLWTSTTVTSADDDLESNAIIAPVVVVKKVHVRVVLILE
jgi:aminoglycoside phosphotransferase (APT) family kinase protein